MHSLSELRKQQYDYHSRMFPYLDNWKRNPYSFLKSRFYMEASAILVYILLKTKIKPNSVTMVYGLVGIVAGVFLSIPSTTAHFIAVLIFFTKGILDWSDGHLARITGQTSFVGHILDAYGAHLNSLGLQIGLGFYVAQRSGIILFYYLVPLIPLFYTANLIFFSKELCMDTDIIIQEIDKYKRRGAKELQACQDGKAARFNNGRIKYCILNFLDDRARTVDFICLLILIEMYTSFFFTWIIFILLIFKQFLIFCGSYFLVVKYGWIENELSNKVAKIMKYLSIP